MKVADIMIKEVRSLSPDDLAKDALYKILNQHISGLPVIDANGNLAGMFTEKDVIQYMLPSYIQHVGKFSYGETPKAIINKLQLLDKIKVKDIMRKEVVTITGGADIAEAAHITLAEHTRRIPVVENKKVIGIIAREDILRVFAHEAVLLKRREDE